MNLQIKSRCGKLRTFYKRGEKLFFKLEETKNVRLHYDEYNCIQAIDAAGGPIIEVNMFLNEVNSNLPHVMILAIKYDEVEEAFWVDI